jgi:hypothetical protein
MYDLIGDIHGHLRPLQELLKKLGYQKSGTSWAHPDQRKVLFIGDYIDRGPENIAVVRLVRELVDAGVAIALMGNHEFNALAYHTKKSKDKFCREHTVKNREQHEHTLNEIDIVGKDEWSSHLDWMLQLPLYYETEGFRAVHACWDAETINQLKNHLGGNQFRSKDDIIEASSKDNPLYHLVETTLKGRELLLPPNTFFYDKGKDKRKDIRVAWWLDSEGKTYRSYCFPDGSGIIGNPDQLIPTAHTGYVSDDKPVFFGHYWLTGLPDVQRQNICCLDYSIAQKGTLAAYRYNGESVLDRSNFVVVDPKNIK